MTAYALRQSKEAVLSYDFPKQFDELFSFFNRDFPFNHPYHGIIPIPNDGDHTLMPAMYMLGSSTGGVQFAMSEGFGFAFASHLAPHLATQVLRGYRNNFKPSKYFIRTKRYFHDYFNYSGDRRRGSVFSWTSELFWARLHTGDIHSPFPTLEEAGNHVYSSAENAARIENKDRFIIGGIETVGQKLRHVAKETMVDEIMIMEYYADKEASQKGYRLLRKSLI